MSSEQSPEYRTPHASISRGNQAAINEARAGQPKKESPEPQPALPGQPDLIPGLAPPSPQKTAPPKRQRSNPEEWKIWSVWRRAIRDKRISHGALRLWHHYRDSLPEGGVRVFPPFASAAFIEREVMLSKRETVSKWNKELEDAGWIKIEPGPYNIPIITVLNGLGVAIEKWGLTKMKAQGELRMAVEYSCPPGGATAAPPQQASCPPRGAATNSKEVTQSKEKNRPSPSAREHWKIMKDLDRVREEKKVALTSLDGERQKRQVEALTSIEDGLMNELQESAPAQKQKEPNTLSLDVKRKMKEMEARSKRAC